MQASRLVRRRPQPSQSDLCTTFCNLYIASRGISSTSALHASTGSNNATPNPMHSAPPGTTRRDANARSLLQANRSTLRKFDESLSARTANLDPIAQAHEEAKKKFEKTNAESQQAVRSRGGLLDNSVFADETLPTATPARSAALEESEDGEVTKPTPVGLTHRVPTNMAAALNPHPSARARWQRKMVIRNIKHRGRLTREMRIARTERRHLLKSHFFKTSMKKLAPLARQIAGKSIDEAILQMRFSVKKAAIEVKQHLLQARNEAIVIKGMGQNSSVLSTQHTSSQLPESEITDPSNTPPTLDMTLLKKPKEKQPTDMYIAEAWVNRGPYAKKMNPRARGKVDIMRPPHTGITVVLKEEKTRIREAQEKAIKEIKRRMNSKSMWKQLPDRPITRQGQYVLW